jgi:transcriptional regulator with PAS, ATPase and Fis domain
VRIIAAANQNLTEMVARKAFREDLFYRLNIVKLELPPLRQRKEDIALLADHFINKLNLSKGKKITGISDDVLRLFMTYGFPGNIRELENLLEHAFVMCRGGNIKVEHLPREFRETIITYNTPHNDMSLQDRFEASEAEIIKEALKRNRSHRGKTAEELGINPATLWRKMIKLGIKDY